MDIPNQKQKSANEKILVVEDDIISQSVIKVLLRQNGYSCDIAKNGAQALKLAANNSYCLMLLDFSLPDMTGTEVAQKIRQINEPQCSIPIVALTSNHEETIKQQCLQSGMNDFANKPITDIKLKQIIATNIKNNIQYEGLSNLSI